LLYRGAWEEWTIPMSKFIVPLSPKDVDDKFSAIIKHQSQKENPLFPGDDKRPFWERVQQRNRETAQVLNKLGFSEYEGCECFVTITDLKNYVEL
jgi:glucosamine-6-phosphate deaminase